MKHTPEPWSFEFSEYGGYDCMLSAHYIKTNAYDIIATLDNEIKSHSESPIQRANAERIVDCVNACAGIEDPVAAIQAARDVLNMVPTYRFALGSYPILLARLTEALNLLTPKPTTP